MIDLEQFSRRHWGPLRRHAYRLTGSILDAEDAVQETMLRAVEMGPALDGIENPAEWLHIAATEATLGLLHEHPPLALEAFELPDLVQTAGPGGAPPLQGEEGWPGVDLAFLFPLQYMDPEQRAVVVLRDALEDGDRIAAAALSATLPEVFQIAEAAERRRAEVRRRWGRNVPLSPQADDPAAARAFARFAEALGLRDKAILQGLLLAEAELMMNGRRESGRDFVATVLAEVLGEAGEEVGFTPVWLNGCRGLLVWLWQERKDEWQRAAALLAVCGESQLRALKWETDGHILRSIRAGEPEG